MTNVSNILPGTTHVWLDTVTYVKSTVNGSDFDRWLTENPARRVDMFAWHADDHLDHFHFAAFIPGQVKLNAWCAPCAMELIDWKCRIERDGGVPWMLLAFEDESDALLFKLTLAGVA
jgi:hypothetical protein